MIEGIPLNDKEVRIVPELFYDEEGTFNEGLWNNCMKHAVKDSAQTPEEMGAVGQSYIILATSLSALQINP